jgi:2-keto-4-pentenoate hydratase/2-oxohepta-3-ene-1,7-dioic acid hydratase in catechol pathway
LGLNYRDHVYEGPFERQEYPAFFMRGATSLVAHGEPIIRSASSVALDYEAELAVIIGRRAHRLREEDCADVIAGYTCFNDGSVRGDVVVMGTPAEVGMARNPPLWMKHGDVVEVEIDAIGTLVNHVQDEPVPALPGARAASAGRSGR